MAMLMRGELAPAGAAVPVAGAVQPAVHDARHDHAAVLRDAAVLRVRQPDHAAADRRARRRVPAAERASPTGCSCSAARSRCSGFLTPGGAADFGWTAYTPLSDVANSPGAGANLWIAGLAVSGLGTILGGVNFIATIVCLRAPGMTMFRMPIFTWNVPGHQRAGPAGLPDPDRGADGAAGRPEPGRAGLQPRRTAGRCCGSTCSGSSATPRSTSSRCRSSASSPRSSRCSAASRCSATRAWSSRRCSIGVLSLAVWAHHMFATGAVLLPFFAFLTYLIAVPTGIKFFNWIGTMWRGQLTFETPMLFVDRLPGHLPARWPDRCAAGQPAAGLARLRHLLRRRPLPLRRLRHRRVRRLRRHLLLVPEDVRPDDGRAAGQAALLADLHRLPRHVPDPALAG